ncbi:hypothetical protein VQL36_00970 [Chengkuizengella sp. SCS-71B]|uniref:hypothetical protein n=1 Tax=Chengkuizengella sp. SCS-71B TaxID=3115290 RepID=UPI0032C241CA
MLKLNVVTLILAGIILIDFGFGMENPELFNVSELMVKMGFLFIVSAMVAFMIPTIIKLIKKTKASYFLSNGIHIKADVKEAFINYSITLKGHGSWNTSTGQSPYKIKAEWYNPKTDQIHIFISENLWIDSSIDLPNQIDVYIKEINPNKYYMDCRSIIDSIQKTRKLNKIFIIHIFANMGSLLIAYFVLHKIVLNALN